MTFQKVALRVGILCVGRLHSSGVFAQDSADTRFPSHHRPRRALITEGICNAMDNSTWDASACCKETCQELWCICVKECPDDDLTATINVWTNALMIILLLLPMQHECMRRRGEYRSKWFIWWLRWKLHFHPVHKSCPQWNSCWYSCSVSVLGPNNRL